MKHGDEDDISDPTMLVVNYYYEYLMLFEQFNSKYCVP